MVGDPRAGSAAGGDPYWLCTYRRPSDGETRLQWPLLVPGLGFGHTIITAASEQRGDALGALQGILLRLLGSLPPGHVRFRVHDPVGVGGSISGFSAFEIPRICAGPTSTSSHELSTIVEQLTSHVNTVSSEYLRGTYGSLSDFLEHAGPGLVPYEILVLLDYPEAVERDLADQIVRLCANAQTRGLYLLVHRPTEADSWAQTPKGAVMLTGDPRGRWHTSLMPALGASLDPPPPGELIAQVAARRVTPPPSLRFIDTLEGEPPDSATSSDGLNTQLGRAGVRPVHVRLDDDIPHGLIAGDTGSGKSNLLRVLLYGLAHRYPPRELQLYLLDFKEGVEFQEFAPIAGDPTFLPHAQVVSVNSSRAFGVAVLEHLADLIANRLHKMGPHGRKLSSLRRGVDTLELARILLVIDEFHVLFGTADQLADRAIAALTAIGKQGRAAGVHFLLATQAIGDVGTGNVNAARLDGVFGAARLRIALRLDDRESQVALRTGNLAAASLHERGMAIVNEKLGAEEGNTPTRVALLDDREATTLRRETLSRVIGARRPPRVFDGDRGARAEANRDLRSAVSAGSDQTPNRTWPGCELAIDPEDPHSYPGLRCDFTADPHRHLAVIGSRPEAAGVLQWASIGLAASTRQATFLLVDLLRDSDQASTAAKATEQALQRLGARVQLTSQSDASTILALATAQLERPPTPPRFIVAFGLDRMVGLDEPIDPNSNDIVAPTQRSLLERLLSEGGARGTHLLAWWSSFDGLEQQAGMQSHNLGMRIYLDVPGQRLQIATAGRYDSPTDPPLALYHDIGRGAEPRELHLYEAFAPDEIPAFLTAPSAP